jgi:hypothetical protein
VVASTGRILLEITNVKYYVLERRRQHREFVPLRHDPVHAQADFGEALAKSRGGLTPGLARCL